MTLLIAALGAFSNRVRGGFLLRLGTMAARLCWAVPLGCLVGFTTGNFYAAFCTAVLAFAGLLLGWGSWIDLKRSPDTFNESLDSIFGRFLKQGTYAYEFISLALRGLLLSALIGITLVLFDFPHAGFFTFAGLAMAPLYELGWRIYERVKWRAGTEYGEVLFGAWLWLALSWSI